MKPSRPTQRSFFPKTTLLALVMLLSVPAWAAFEQRKTFGTDRLTVRNLIGEVRIEPGRGSDFEVLVTIAGRDAKDGLIRLDASDSRLEIRLYAVPE